MLVIADEIVNSTKLSEQELSLEIALLLCTKKAFCPLARLVS